jgi:hypothetical protein
MCSSNLHPPRGISKRIDALRGAIDIQLYVKKAVDWTRGITLEKKKPLSGLRAPRRGLEPQTAWLIAAIQCHRAVSMTSSFGRAAFLFSLGYFATKLQ